MASAFGVFTIVANDGRQDHMLMATELLNQRIERIKQVRRQAGFSEQDVYPSILDIERTHILFVTAHFKPFAAIAFEYHRVEATNVSEAGAKIRYSIPQYGDFFADMAHYLKFKKLNYVPAPVTAEDAPNMYRYCDYPGERIHKHVRFTVNGNGLDEYEREAYVMYRQFRVAPNKRAGWNRLVGQETPREAYLEQVGSANQASRVGMSVYDGYQTPKADHPALETTTPLLLWFCQDFRLAVPSVAIPYGQRWLTIQTASSNELVETVAAGDSTLEGDNGTLGSLVIDTAALYVNNLFVNNNVHDIFIRRIGFTLIRVHLRHTEHAVKQSERVKLTQLQWPVEAMFFGFRPRENFLEDQANNVYANHPIFSKSRGKGTLQNWHRFCHTDVCSEPVPGVAGTAPDAEGAADMAALIKHFETTYMVDPHVVPALDSVIPAIEALGLTSTVAQEVLAAVATVTNAVDDSARLEAFRLAINPYRESAMWLDIPLANTLNDQLTSYDTANRVRGLGVVETDLTDTSISTNLEGVVANAAAKFGATAQSVYDAVQSSGYTSTPTTSGVNARMEVRRNSPVVAHVSLEAHNVKLYQQQYSKFFSDYLPFAYGGHKINTPDDECLYMVSFALYPGTYQPSGHLNLSRVREFHLGYTTVRTTVDMQLYVLVSAINFLLIADGSASLRYTT